MTSLAVPPNENPADFNTRLFAAWVHTFAEQQHGVAQYGSSDSVYNFGNPDEEYFALAVQESGEISVREIRNLSVETVEGFIRRAIEKVVLRDLGGTVVYNTSLHARAFEISAVSMNNFFRLLNDQVYVEGWRRLSDMALLEFLPTKPPGPASALFAPETVINVTLFVPGPSPSDLTSQVAAGAAEIVAAICALALGRVVETPMAIFPASADDAKRANEKRTDSSILGLARDHTSLDVFGEFAALGGADGVARIRGALLTHHAALRQSSPDVALMLMVSSLEALVVPRPEWRKDKATKRFIEAIDQLCPEAVDAIASHRNVERAFAYKKRGGPRAQHRQLLNQIYELRSIPTHSGIGLSAGGSMMYLPAWPGGIR